MSCWVSLTKKGLKVEQSSGTSQRNALLSKGRRLADTIGKWVKINDAPVLGILINEYWLLCSSLPCHPAVMGRFFFDDTRLHCICVSVQLAKLRKQLTESKRKIASAVGGKLYDGDVCEKYSFCITKRIVS